MVWAISKSIRLGKYRLYGHFETHGVSFAEGWRGRLTQYYLNDMPEAEKEKFRFPELVAEGEISVAKYYASFVKYKFSKELGSIHDSYNHPITPIEAHEVPTSFMTEKGHKQLGDLIEMGGALAASSKLAQIIEDLEPGVHQSFDMPIICPNGSRIEGYKLLVVGNYFDAVVPDEEVIFADKKNVTGPPSDRLGEKKYLRQLEFRKSEFDGGHLWYDRKLQRHLVCVSDELMDAIQKHGLVIAKNAQMVEV